MAAADPFKGMRFRVEIQGIQQAGFSECSAIGSHLEVIEYREGGDPDRVRKFPGKRSFCHRIYFIKEGWFRSINIRNSECNCPW